MVVILATASYDSTIRFWDASTGLCSHSMTFGDKKQVNCLEISQNKRYLAAAGNPHVKVYDLESNSHDALFTLEGHSANVTEVGFQRDCRWMYTASEDGTIRVWDMRSPNRECQRTYDAPGAVNTVILHPNQGELIAGDGAGCITVWDLAADKCVNELVPEPGSAISSVSIASNASIVVGATHSGNCYFWDSRGSSDSLTPLKKLQAHKTYILRCRLSPDAQYLATCSSDRTCKLWNVNDFSLFNTLSGHSRWVWDCRFSADSMYIVTGSSDSQARLWDVSSGEAVRAYTGHTKAVVAVALNDAITE